MFQDAFKKLELDEIATILDQIKDDLDAHYDPIETTILAWNAPFYPGCRVLEIANHDTMPAIKTFAVYSPKKWAILNYTSDMIFKLNKEIPLQLSRENIGDYIRYFFFFVKGKHGKYHVVESVDDINWKDDPPPQARKAIGAMIMPITLVPPPPGEDKSKFFAVGNFMLKNALFKSEIVVDSKGKIDLVNEQLQVGDIPVNDDILGS